MQQIIVSSYFEKQRAFRSLVKDIQISLTSKVYKQYGCSLNDFIRMKWNISQAQAYRYLVCAKVLDQLEEFEIQPSYERLCRTLYNTVKTPSQMKLLWSTLLRKTGNRAEIINSTHISQTWKELCKDKKYSKICNYEDDVMKKIEESLNKFSNEKKHKQLKQKKEENKTESNNTKNQTINTNTNNIKTNNTNTNNNNIKSISHLPSPSLSESSISNQSEINEKVKQNKHENNKYSSNFNSISFIPSPELSISSLTNQTNNINNIPFSSVDNCNLLIPTNEITFNNSYNVISTPPNECINYLTLPNEIQCQKQSQAQVQSLLYYQEIPQQIPQQIIYYY